MVRKSVFSLLALSPLTMLQAGEKPNIIFVLCDDMGYGDLGCYGQRYIHTPHIDRLAEQGMRFTQAYAGSPVSAPSRASLMTGQHTGHCEIRGNKEYWSGDVIYGMNHEYSVTGQHPLDPGHVVLPEVMKANGYRTAQFGKWAGGYEGSVSTPDKRGVDEFYGYICQFQAHLYYPNFLNRYSRSRGDSAVVREILEQNIQHAMSGEDYLHRQEYSADLIHRRAMQWLNEQDGKVPFYGLLTYTLPHAELVQPEDSILQSYKRQFLQDKSYAGNHGARYNATTHTHAQFAAMITRLDAYVGEIMQKLEEKGLADNTILIFSSDNGPHEEGGADPAFFNRDGKLRGLKRSCHEGGIRVPFIVRWPDQVRAGSVSDHPIAFYDVLPTFCDMLGQTDFRTRYGHGREDHFDGLSFLPTLQGKGKEQLSHEFLYWEFNETDQIAVRWGDWKLLVKQGRPALYDLSTDLHEDHDLSSRYPGILRRLLGYVRKAHTDNIHFRVTLPQ